MPLPKFAEVGSTKTFRAPYSATGVRFYGFLLDADLDRLNALAASAFGDPSGGKADYRAVLPFALLSFTSIAKLCSAEPPDDRIGWVSEKEAALWVLTVAEKRELGIPVAQRLAFYIPYIFVDQGNALLTGREVEGFPKELGAIDVDDPASMTAKAWVFPELSPETAVTLKPVVTARADTVAKPEPGWGKLEDAVRGIWKELGSPLPLPSLGLLFHLIDGLLEREVSLCFLKQFRDVRDSSRACYQAVVEAPIKVTGFRGGGVLPGRYAVDLPAYASHPIAAQLGIDTSKTRALKGFWLDFDFLLEQGNVVWEAT